MSGFQIRVLFLLFRFGPDQVIFLLDQRVCFQKSFLDPVNPAFIFYPEGITGPDLLAMKLLVPQQGNRCFQGSFQPVRLLSHRDSGTVYSTELPVGNQDRHMEAVEKADIIFIMRNQTIADTDLKHSQHPERLCFR